MKLLALALISFCLAPRAFANPAVGVQFETQPTDTVAGSLINPTLKVKLIDADGNIVTKGPDATAVLTLSISDNSPNPADLSGTTTVAAVNGIALFPGVQVNAAGVHVLTVTKNNDHSPSNDTFSANSRPFTVRPNRAFPTTSRIYVSHTKARADGTQAITVFIQLKDVYGNPVTGVTTKFASENSADLLTQPSTVTDETGTAIGEIASTSAYGQNLSIAEPEGLTADQVEVSFEAGPPVALEFLRQPKSVNVRDRLEVTVNVVDQYDNPVWSYRGPVTLSLAESAGDLSGETTVTINAGSAFFGNISVNRAGQNFHLVATSTGLKPVTSNGFNVNP